MTESLTPHTQSHTAKPSEAIRTSAPSPSDALSESSPTSAPSPSDALSESSPTSAPSQSSATAPSRSAASAPSAPRTAFAARVDEASDALGLDASETEKELIGHWIVGAWEDRLACTDCTKDDDETLSCAMRTLVREDGIIRSVAVRCERYYQAQARRRTERLFGASQLGEHFSRRTFSTFCADDGSRDALDACRTLAETFTLGARGLLLAGDCGCGKTHLAAAVLHTLIARGYRALFMTTARLLAALKSAFGDAERTQELKRELAGADLLILDDLGAEHMTDWARSELGSIINDRYEANRTLILTTNLTLSALTARYGKRTVSRIAEMTDGVRITSGDYRLRRHLERRTP